MTHRRDVLEDSGKAAIARVVIRTRQYIAAIFPRAGALVLMLLRYHQELRSTDELDLPSDAAAKKVTKKERDTARTLIDSMQQDWHPTEYHDEYREQLMTWIENKIDSGEVEPTPGAEAPRGADERSTTNLMDALKKSVSHTAGERDGRPAKRTTKEKTTRKAKAAKASARKSSRKTTSSKRSAKSRSERSS